MCWFENNLRRLQPATSDSISICRTSKRDAPLLLLLPDLNQDESVLGPLIALPLGICINSREKIMPVSDTLRSGTPTTLGFCLGCKSDLQLSRKGSYINVLLIVRQ